jgi:hypothetical protein
MLLILASGVIGALSGIVLVRKRRSERAGFARLSFVHSALAALLIALCLTAACGGGSRTPTTPKNFTLTVTATSGGAVLPITLNLTVQ